MSRTDEAPARIRIRMRRLRAFRTRVRAMPGGRIVWRVAVTVIGVVVVAIGVVLLPLPGPGWVIIFAGLGILASEYAWAARLLKWVRNTLVRWTRWLAALPLWLRLLASVLSLAVLADIVWGAWFVAGKPGL
jgi:uncharacterized protein (TIGR02611 family)